MLKYLGRFVNMVDEECLALLRNKLLPFRCNGCEHGGNGGEHGDSMKNRRSTERLRTGYQAKAAGPGHGNCYHRY